MNSQVVVEDRQVITEDREDREDRQVADEVITDEVTEIPYKPLQNTWIIYDHEKSDKETYEKSTRKICSFGDVVKFWQCYNHYPSPGYIFNNGFMKPLINGREISSVSIFKDGIFPKWEDPANKYGAEISKRRFNKKNPLDELEEDWFNLLLACIGENIDDCVTGLRIVDSSSLVQDKKASKCYKLLFRIELWFSDISKKDLIEDKFRSILNIDKDECLFYKEHIVPVNK